MKIRILIVLVTIAFGWHAGAQPPAPNAGSPAPTRIPGLIQAEACDAGGEGVGFHASDNATNITSPSLTPTIIQATDDSTAVELRKGDWLRYTVAVKTTRMYTLEFRVAHQTGSDPLFKVTCDGTNITGTMNAPYTGGSEHWVTLKRPAVNLSAGRHVFKVEQVGGTSFFLDWIKITPGKLPVAGPKPNLKNWELVWSDEFNTDGRPDETKWTYDIGGGGWGNRELEYYTDRPENARVENGKLIIEARAEDYKGNHYTSARLLTRGRQSFTYGRVEVRAKLPSALGTWPAIWMLGANGKRWPECGELDIMEHLGNNPGWIHASTHSLKYFFKNGNQKTSIYYAPDTTSAFHEYAMEWYPDHIVFFVDNNPCLTVKDEGTGTAAWPFNDPEFIILNVALGGWGGPVTNSELPARMEVDYVRVYKHK